MLVHVRQVDVRLETGAHPHEAENGAAIEAHWSARLKENPALYDGRTVLGTSWRLDNDIARVTCRPIRYATLLHWLGAPARENPGGPCHVFASAVMTGSDGGIVFGRMADHTFNGGRVYMPSGSLEAEDFGGGLADLHANMRREALEETGIDLADALPVGGYDIYRGRGLCAIFRQYRFAAGGGDLAASANRHIAAQRRPELSEALVLFRGETRPQMPAHVEAYMRQPGS